MADEMDQKITKMLSNDFSTTHWASPSRKNRREEAPPNILAEEVLFSVDESVEFRVYGRHGWHVGRVVNREMSADGTAMRYLYTVENLSSSFGPLGEISGLKAGNIRRPADYGAHFSLAMSPPPAVDDFRPLNSLNFTNERATSPIVSSTRRAGTSKVSTAATTRQSDQVVQSSTYDTCEHMDHEVKVQRTSEISQPSSLELITTANAMPQAVTQLLQHGKTRGINIKMWFTPPEGWCDGSKVIDGEFFIKKLTHMGLRLAVGRPMKEHMLIEEALSSHNLEEAVKVASMASSKTLDACSAHGQGYVDVDWLVDTLGLSYDTSSPSSKGETDPLEGITERVQTYAFNKFSQDPQVKAEAQITPLRVTTWKRTMEVVEAKLKKMCRYHKDKFYKLRVSLKMIEPHLSVNVSSFSQNNSFSDASRVGAAAAAVFQQNKNQSSTSVATCEDGSDWAKGTEITAERQRDMVSVGELKKAFHVNDFNGWKLREVEALMRKVCDTAEEETTPSSVDRGALKDYLMGMMLQYKVGYDAWTSLKAREHYSFKSSLLESFSDLLSGEAEVDSEISMQMIGLVEKLEQAPSSFDMFQNETYQTLLQAEATHLAEMWLTTSDARQRVRDQMVKTLEDRRLENTQSSDSDHAATLFQLYQRHVTRWYKLKRMAEEPTLRQSADSYSVSQPSSDRSKPPSLNEWLQVYADPTGTVKKQSMEIVLLSKAEEYLNSEESPLIELNCNDIPKGWKCLGEVDRFEQHGTKVVKFKPMMLTKQLLKQFLLDKQPKAGFYDWLETREKHREDTKSKVGEWSSRKDRVRSLIKAKANLCAVLSMDTGGVGEGHTIDSLVKGMVPFTEVTEGEGVGSFKVRKPSRKNLSVDKCLRRVASKSVEVPPKPADQTLYKLKQLLRQVMNQYVADKDASRVLHVNRVRIPSVSDGFSDLRFKGDDTDLIPSDSTSHASKIDRYMNSSKNKVVEVKVLNNGKWHQAVLLSTSDKCMPLGERLGDQENIKSNASTQRRSSVTTKPKAVKYPNYYTVRLLEASHPDRLEEEVEKIVRECAQQGEKCMESVDGHGRVRVSYECLSAEEALQGQQRVLNSLCTTIAWKETSALMELPWVGPVSLPGTGQMPKRRTHAFIVSKGILDEELEPCLTSMLADRTARHSAMQLMDDFDFGVNRKTSNQAKLVIRRLDTASATLQNKLMETTNGMFHTEEQRQVEMAQELADERDRQADIAFKEWTRTKALQHKKDAAARKAAQATEGLKDGKEKENKIAFKEWVKTRNKKKYVGRDKHGNKVVKAWPAKKKPLVQKPWSFAPPVSDEEIS